MKSYRPIAAIAFLALGLTLCQACRTNHPLPPADFLSPGWRVRQGQAVWKPSRKRPELAGDLLLATSASGDCVVQFTKVPFTLATARVTDGAWQIELGGGRFSRGGHGAPPSRFAWFQLPRALAAKRPDPPWLFTDHPDNSWRLENTRTGEFLEGVLFQ